MAEPMWSGGHPQFQDEYPWIWAIMSGWMQTPFYPTDPPRDPGAMADSVVPIADLPVIGGFYGYFIIKYCEEYAAAWYASPPGTSSSTPVAVDVPGSWTPPGDNPYSNYYLKQQHDTYFGELTTSLGYDPTTTVHDKLDAIAAAVGAIPEPNPNPATTSDVARILAALYYIAEMVVVPAWSMDTTAIEDKIDEAVVSIVTATEIQTDAVAETITDPTTGAIRQINDNVNAAELAIRGNTDAAETAILEALANLPPATGGPTGYPGLDSVTLSNPVAFSGPMNYAQVMDGCLVEFTSMPAGTGHNDVGNFTNWQHAGWLCFIDDNGYADEVQWLGPEKANYCPKRLAAASALLIFPRVLSSGTITPWVRNA